MDLRNISLSDVPAKWAMDVTDKLQRLPSNIYSPKPKAFNVRIGDGAVILTPSGEHVRYDITVLDGAQEVLVKDNNVHFVFSNAQYLLMRASP